jgi:tetratricopeptide (TPR) repeat protein
LERVIEVGAHLQAALAHHRAGELEEAEALYSKILSVAPNHPHALRLLGIIETGRGHPERGAKLIGMALPALSRFPEVHLDHGDALRLAGKPEEALDAFRRALELKPDQPLAHVRLGGLLTHLGRFEAAIGHCQAATAIDPRCLPARLVLIAALKGVGRLSEVADAWRAVIAIEPNRAESFHQLALELVGLGLFAEALHCHDRAIALRADLSDFHSARGQTLMHLHDGVRAEVAFRAAIALEPRSKLGWAGLGWALRLLGRFNEADGCAKRLREIDPEDLLAVRHLPSTGGQLADATAEIDRLASVLDSSEAKAEDRITAGFALGRLLDDAGRFDEAFPRYAAANALVRRRWPPKGDTFDAESFARQVDRAIESYSPELLADAGASGNVSELPVFIVGMPRSGTTLVEQICASHSQIHGAGELHAIHRLAMDLAQLLDDDEAAKAAARRRLADAHILHLHGLGNGALRVVDKLPDNVMYVGLIARLFPRARIIYCSRDARDTSLSCFFQLFMEGAQYFSYDLADCGRRCREVERLCTHWQKLLPLHMIEVNYERLVDDLAGESRRLIDFLGLEFEPRCLDFHRTERTVATVSHWQVRQPLYRNSIGRWRNYEKHLAPFLAAISDVRTTPSAIDAGAA